MISGHFVGKENRKVTEAPGQGDVKVMRVKVMQWVKVMRDKGESHQV